MSRLMTLILLLGWPALSLAEPATMSRADTLVEKPFADAKAVGKLPAGQVVDIQKRDGAWYQIKAGGKAGWVKMLSVRRTAPAATASVGSAAQVATGRAGTGKIVATTGVRGLGEETLQEAAFSERAVAAAEAFRSTPAEAERLAQAKGLAPRRVPALAAAGTGEGGSP